jgi:uncharacterized protein YoxC
LLLLKGGKMNNIFLGLITLAFILGVIIFIVVAMDLRKTIRAFKELVNMIENSLKPTVAELQGTLKSVRHVADNVTGVSEDMRTLSGALREFGENMKGVSGDIRGVANFFEGIASSATVETSSLKAGVRAGFGFLLRNLFK